MMSFQFMARYSSVEEMMKDMKVSKKVMRRFKKLVADDQKHMEIVTDGAGKVRMRDKRTGEYV